jgi:flavin reductase (DIM6/NTAB) family NADH-FMN oxidoreductase RutF/rubredoxin
LVRFAEKITTMDYQAFFSLSYGIYLICSNKGNEPYGYIANTAFQVTSEPPQIAISCHKNNLTGQAIGQSRVFSLSVLHKGTGTELLQKFGYSSGDPAGKFAGIQYKTGVTGTPVVLTDAAACFECRVVNSVDAGTHMLFIGEVVEAEVLDPGKEPLTYAYYRNVMKASAPPNAPTYVDKSRLQPQKTKEEPGNEYLCQICGYTYDPAEGDPKHGIPPGTKWEDLPDDWICPVCRAGKKFFKKL